jgi:hypothetical protein
VVYRSLYRSVFYFCRYYFAGSRNSIGIQVYGFKPQIDIIAAFRRKSILVDLELKTACRCRLLFVVEMDMASLAGRSRGFNHCIVGPGISRFLSVWFDPMSMSIASIDCLDRTRLLSPGGAPGPHPAPTLDQGCRALYNHRVPELPKTKKLVIRKPLVSKILARQISRGYHVTMAQCALSLSKGILT